MPRFRRPILPPRRRFPGSHRRPLQRRAAKIAIGRLKEAHSLLAQGKPKEAAVIFCELADAATRHGIPRAAQLNLQAARALIAAGEIEPGLDRIRQGLSLMAEMKQFARLPNVCRRILDELEEQGLTKEAGLIETEIQTLLSKHGLSLAAAVSIKDKPNLPVKCPYCGGNVQIEEVEWLDRQQAMCAYCGSRLAE